MPLDLGRLLLSTQPLADALRDEALVPTNRGPTDAEELRKSLLPPPTAPPHHLPNPAPPTSSAESMKLLGLPPLLLIVIVVPISHCAHAPKKPPQWAATVTGAIHQQRVHHRYGPQAALP